MSATTVFSAIAPSFVPRWAKRRALFFVLLQAVVLVLGLASPAPAREAVVVIDYAYSDARDFHEGLAAVLSNDLWGYIDPLGRVVIPFVHRVPDAGPFSEGLAFVGDRFIDPAGKAAFDGKTFEAALPFSEGLAAVQTAGRWGYVDKTGNFALPPLYEGAGTFAQGLAPVQRDGLWGYIDARGRMKIGPRFLRAEPFSEGAALVELDGRVGYVNLSGVLVIPPSHDDGGPFGNSLAPVKGAPSSYRGWGYVDAKGRFIVPRRYNGAQPFRDGLAPVATDARWGYINIRGRMVLAPLYDAARPFREGLAAVRQEDKWGYIRVR